MPILNQPIPDLAATKKTPSADELLAANISVHVVSDYEIASGRVLELSADSVFHIT